MKICFDIDGVLASYATKFIEVAQKLYGKKQVNVRDYNFGLDLKEVKRVNVIMVRSHMYENLKLTDTALDILALNSTDVIWYMTARSRFSNGETRLNNSIREQTMIWLSDNKFPQCENLIFTEEKGLTCYELGVKYLVEDNLESAIEAYRLGITAYIIDRYYNREETLPGMEYPHRVKTIREAIRDARQREKRSHQKNP